MKIDIFFYLLLVLISFLVCFFFFFFFIFFHFSLSSSLFHCTRNIQSASLEATFLYNYSVNLSHPYSFTSSSYLLFLFSSLRVFPVSFVSVLFMILDVSAFEESLHCITVTITGENKIPILRRISISSYWLAKLCIHVFLINISIFLKRHYHYKWKRILSNFSFNSIFP